VKISIIGGSSFSTPCLLRFLDQANDGSRMEVVLASRSRKKLDAVTRATRLLTPKGISIRAQEIADNTWHQILDGADCVLIQIRVGGFEGRLYDETFPHKYGLCGDEGLGAGGLSAGWRNWPAVSRILDSVAKFSPSALVVMITSPLSILVRAAIASTDLNVIGICELPWTTLQNLRRIVRPPTGELQADYFGVNHLGWFFNIRSRSDNLIDDLADRTGNILFPSSTFVRTHRCVPTTYLRLHYEAARVLQEQLSQEAPRARSLLKLRDQAYRIYESGEARDVVSALEGRPSPWYPHAIGPLLMALAGKQTEIPFFLSTPHSSYSLLPEPSDIVETAHYCVGGKLSQLPLAGPPPAHVIENLLPLVRFERMATEAIMRRECRLLVEALSWHPWMQENIHLESIAEEIVKGDTLVSK
jgi:6-phospho-beta-glucosidase